MQKVQRQASVPGRGFSRSEAGSTPHAHPGRMDSPLKGYVLFSRAWHTANTKPVGEAERAGKCHLRKELPWGSGKDFRILLRGRQVYLATFFEGLSTKWKQGPLCQAQGKHIHGGGAQGASNSVLLRLQFLPTCCRVFCLLLFSFGCEGSHRLGTAPHIHTGADRLPSKQELKQCTET